MALTALYMRKGGAEDMFLDADTHSVPVSSTTNRNVTGLAAYFLRIDGTSTGTGDWLTTGKMTASYFVATHATTYSELPKLLATTTLRVVSSSVLEVDATSLDCGVAANFTAAVAMTAGLTSNTAYVGSSIPTGSEKLKSESLRTGSLYADLTSTLTGAVSMGATLAVTGATTLSSTLAVTGASTLTGLVTMTAGATVPSGGTLTVASGATLTVGGTLNITTLTASTATIAGATGGSETLRTTTFRATGASVFTNTVTLSSSLTVSGATSLTSASATGTVEVSSAGGITNQGTANYFSLPAGGDTSTAASIDFDALDTKNSHQFNPSGNRSITSIAGTRKGLYWFVNIHATSTVTFADALVAYPAGAFVMAADSTALVYWDNSTLTVVCAYS